MRNPPKKWLFHALWTLVIAICLLAWSALTTWRYATYGLLLRYHGARNHSFVQTTGTVFDHDRRITSPSRYNSTRHYYTILHITYPYQDRLLTWEVSLYDYRTERIRLFSGSELITENWRQIPLLVYPIDPTTLIPSYEVVVFEYWLRLIWGFLFWAVIAIPFGAWGLWILANLYFVYREWKDL
jgi:hypothetical protein